MQTPSRGPSCTLPVPTVTEPKKISLSNNPPTIHQIKEHHEVIKEAIFLYYSPENLHFIERFGLKTKNEIRASRDEKLGEVGASFAVSLFAAIEASFQVDAFLRQDPKEQDELSNKLRDLHDLRNSKGKRLSLDDILQVWKGNSDQLSVLVSSIRTAFNDRHWLAHGRYLVPKLGHSVSKLSHPSYFDTIYDLGCRIEKAFQFLRP